jgi:spermidine/putrescine transport system substrate-binding protein
MTKSGYFRFIVVLLSVAVLSVGTQFTDAHAGAKPYEGQTLIVGVWSGPYAKNFEAAISQPFTELTGAKILHKYSWDFTPEILAAPADDPPLDVTEAADSDYWLGVQRKLWLPIRYENVSNYDKLFGYVKNTLSPTTEFGVPFDAGINGLVYRKDLVQTPPTTWKDYLKPEYKGKISVEQWFPYWVYWASFMTDYEPGYKAIYSPEGRDAIIEAAKKLSQNWMFAYNSGSEFWSALESGEIVAGEYTIGSIISKIKELEAKQGQSNLAMVLPPEGGWCYTDHLCVVRGTKKRDLAEAFINYAVSTEAQIAFLTRHHNLLFNKEVVPHIPEILKGIHPEKDDDWNRVIPIDAETLEPLRKELTERFTKEVLIQ